MSTPLPQTPGDLIRARLADLGWSQTDLAKVIGVKRMDVVQRMNGVTRFRASDAVCFGAALAIEPIAILHAQSLCDLSSERGRPLIRQRAAAKAQESGDRARAMARACDAVCAPDAEAAE